jgi:hypothetical protein
MCNDLLALNLERAAGQKAELVLRLEAAGVDEQ